MGIDFSHQIIAIRFYGGWCPFPWECAGTMNVVTTGIVLETVAGWFCSCASVPNVYRFSFCIHPIYIYNNSIREFAYTMILSRDHCYSLSRDIYISAALVFMSMNATKSTLIACPSWLSYLLIMPSCGESHSIEANRPFFRARQLPFLRWTRHSWDELAIPEIYSPFLRWTRHSWDELAIPSERYTLHSFRKPNPLCIHNSNNHWAALCSTSYEGTTWTSECAAEFFLSYQPSFPLHREISQRASWGVSLFERPSGTRTCWPTRQTPCGNKRVHSFSTPIACLLTISFPFFFCQWRPLSTGCESRRTGWLLWWRKWEVPSNRFRDIPSLSYSSEYLFGLGWIYKHSTGCCQRVLLHSLRLPWSHSLDTADSPIEIVDTTMIVVRGSSECASANTTLSFRVLQRITQFDYSTPNPVFAFNALSLSGPTSSSQWHRVRFLWMWNST